jgi:uncharacterized Zn finger protein
MADDDLVVALHCPNCGHDGARPYIGSATVLTVKCSACVHVWSVDTNTLAPEIRKQINAALETTPTHR